MFIHINIDNYKSSLLVFLNVDKICYNMAISNS